MITTQVRAKFTPQVVSQLGWVTAGSLATIIIGSGLWWIGAGFTIVFFRFLAGLATNPSDALLGQVAWTWYLFPLVFSLVEIAGWKVNGSLAPRIQRLAMGVTAIDMGSTGYGVFVAITSTYLAMVGIVNPESWMIYVAFVAAAVAGWWITLTPERLVLDALAQLYENAKFIRTAMKG